MVCVVKTLTFVSQYHCRPSAPSPGGTLIHKLIRLYRSELSKNTLDFLGIRFNCNAYWYWHINFLNTRSVENKNAFMQYINMDNIQTWSNVEEIKVCCCIIVQLVHTPSPQHNTNKNVVNGIFVLSNFVFLNAMWLNLKCRSGIDTVGQIYSIRNVQMSQWA